MTDIILRRIAPADVMVRAYVANNRLPAADVPKLVTLVHQALLALADGLVPTSCAPGARRRDADEISRSVRPVAIISFINGRTYRTLRRHLNANGLDPKAYRERYGLPHDYPMVASAYSERRSRITRGIGCGVGPDGTVKDGARSPVEPGVRSGRHLQPI